MIGGNPEGVETCWLAYGPLYQYPSEGGTWQYGFWNAKVRSYYTVNRCHGSTVKLNGKTSRSVNLHQVRNLSLNYGLFNLILMTSISIVFVS